MSGHSKWENIKRKKGKTDAIRAKITTKISKEITIAARMGGGDPVGNMRLKLALTKAKQNNVPKDNIQRAIAKGVGAASGAGFDEITYEGTDPAARRLSLSAIRITETVRRRTYAMPLPTMAAASVRRAVWRGCSRKRHNCREQRSR